MSKILAFLFGLALSSCVHRTEEAFQKEFLTWQGRAEKDVVSQFGYPNQTHSSPDGNRVYEYVWSRSYVSDPWPSFYRSPLYAPARMIQEYYCVVWFELKEHTVAKVTWRGNDCLAVETQ